MVSFLYDIYIHVYVYIYIYICICIYIIIYIYINHTFNNDVNNHPASQLPVPVPCLKWRSTSVWPRPTWDNLTILLAFIQMTSAPAGFMMIADLGRMWTRWTQFQILITFIEVSLHKYVHICSHQIPSIIYTSILSIYRKQYIYNYIYIYQSTNLRQ